MAIDDRNKMLINDLADHFGITTYTVRWYEMMGLIDRPEKAKNGKRYYGKYHLQCLEFILKLKTAGLSLDEIKDISILHNCESGQLNGCKPHLIPLIDIHLNAIKQNIMKLESLGKEIASYRKHIEEKCRYGS